MRCREGGLGHARCQLRVRGAPLGSRGGGGGCSGTREPPCVLGRVWGGEGGRGRGLSGGSERRVLPAVEPASQMRGAGALPAARALAGVLLDTPRGRAACRASPPPLGAHMARVAGRSSVCRLHPCPPPHPPAIQLVMLRRVPGARCRGRHACRAPPSRPRCWAPCRRLPPPPRSASALCKHSPAGGGGRRAGSRATRTCPCAWQDVGGRVGGSPAGRAAGWAGQELALPGRMECGGGPGRGAGAEVAQHGSP